MQKSEAMKINYSIKLIALGQTTIFHFALPYWISSFNVKRERADQWCVKPRPDNTIVEHRSFVNVFISLAIILYYTQISI